MYQSYNNITFGSLTAFLEDTVNGLYKKLVDMGWTLQDDIDAVSGQTDRVYKTIGEDGTEVGFIRIHQANGGGAIQMYIGSWYPVTPTAPPGNKSNEVGHATYCGVVSWAAGSVTAWLGGDKDFVGFVIRQGIGKGTYGNYCFGFPKRKIPLRWSGRTTLTAVGVTTVAAYGITTLAVGSTANLTVGQKLFIINHDPAAAAARQGMIVRCTLQGIGAGTIDVTNDSSVATDFDSGALVGLDPMPMCLFTGTAAQHGTAAGAGVCFIYDPATMRMTGTDQFVPNHICFTGIVGYEYAHFGGTVKGPLTDFIGPANNRVRDIYPWVMFGHYDQNGNVVVLADQCRGIIDRFMFLPAGPYVWLGFVPEDLITDGTTTWQVFRDSYSSGTEYPPAFPALRIVA